MTSFKNFRNRGKDSRFNGGSSASDPSAELPDNDQLPRSSEALTATEMGPQHLEILRQIEAEGEPLSLAEELADLADRGEFDAAAARLQSLNKQGETHIAELQRMSMPQLIEEARKENLTEVSGMKRQDL